MYLKVYFKNMKEFVLSPHIIRCIFFMSFGLIFFLLIAIQLGQVDILTSLGILTIVCVFRYSFDLYLPIISYCLFAALSTCSSSLGMVFKSTRGNFKKNQIFKIIINTIVSVSSYNSYRRHFKYYILYSVHF